MTIEERLENLAQTVELLAGMQIETEKRMSRMADTVQELATHGNELLEMTATMTENLAQLTRIAIDHRQRIENLEGNRPL